MKSEINNETLPQAMWDEENRLKHVYDEEYTLSSYLYDAGGERTLKLWDGYQYMMINGQQQIGFFDITDYTLYTSPYMVLTPEQYTKHYYAESDRIVSKIGGGMQNNIYPIGDQIYGFNLQSHGDYLTKADNLVNRMYDDYNQLNVSADLNANFNYWLSDAQPDEPEEMIFFYHKDLPKAFGMGSSTQISDPGANIIQHIEYLPYGETFFERRSYWNTPYKFNAKELDEETGMYYYGARYYTPEVSIWLSVDPLADLFASKSPFAYCFNNPVHFIDEDGNWPWEAKNVRAARKLSRKTGGTFQKWEGDNGKTWASVDYCTAKNYKRKESEKGGALAKVFSPEGRSWGQAIVSFIKKMDEGGSSDGANRGTITEQDIKVGIGIMGSIAGLGSVYSLAIISNKPILLISSSLFTINNIDDAFTNADGESGFQQMVSSTQEKENIKNVKTAINIISVGSGYKSFVQSKDIYSGIGATISAISLSDSKLTETKNKNNTGENLRYPKSKPKFE